ncbi:MAG TPA: glycosyltransferase family 39 protein [Pyrinomonadaceae bacterium]|nr:glycosyltransferase family 39 protein [Pyrinomonadaceae bacterium]
MSRRWRIHILLAAALAFALKLYLALTTGGTLDVQGFADHLAKIEQLGGVGAYHALGAFNNPFNSPPFIIHALKALGWLTAATGLPFAFWLRLPCALADVGSLFVVWKLSERSGARRETAWTLLLLALSPVSIIISGFHGNTDPVMVFFVLLSVYLLEAREERFWLAALAFGMALNIKVAPLVYAPALWFYLPRLRRRVWFFAVAAIVFLVGSLPYILLDPVVIARRVFGYGSIYGAWGWTYLAATWFPHSLQFTHAPHDVTGAHAVAASIGKWLMLGLLVANAAWINRRADRPPLHLQLGLATSLFLFLTPGFGSQYLAWLVPFVVFLGVGATLMYNLVGGLFLFVSYSCWIYRAAPPVYCVEPLMSALPLVCWAMVFVLLTLYASRVTRVPVHRYNGAHETD